MSIDYGDLIPLHPETEEEAIEQDKQLTKMNTTLKAKKLHPKSYLPQVNNFLRTKNVSHQLSHNLRQFFTLKGQNREPKSVSLI